MFLFEYRSSTPDILRKNTAGDPEPETNSVAKVKN